MAITDEMIQKSMIFLLKSGKSVAPRDVAQHVAAEGEDWRVYLPRIKSIALSLHKAGKMTVLRKGKPLTADSIRGLYRIAGADFTAGGKNA